jgi:hypothetical protein
MSPAVKALHSSIVSDHGVHCHQDGNRILGVLPLFLFYSLKLCNFAGNMGLTLCILLYLIKYQHASFECEIYLPIGVYLGLLPLIQCNIAKMVPYGIAKLFGVIFLCYYMNIAVCLYGILDEIWVLLHRFLLLCWQLLMVCFIVQLFDISMLCYCKIAAHNNGITVSNLALLHILLPPLVIVVTFHVLFPYYQLFKIPTRYASLPILTLQKILPHFLQTTIHMNDVKASVTGGYRTRAMTYNHISSFISNNAKSKCTDIESKKFHFVEYIDRMMIEQYSAEFYLQVNIPMHVLIRFVPMLRAHELAKLHGIEAGFKSSTAALESLFKDHQVCAVCETHITIICVQLSFNEHKKLRNQKVLLKKTDEEKKSLQEKNQKRVAAH